ncbi:MAG TPA: response regulator, partial [Pseudonocardiaceae bacterium]
GVSGTWRDLTDSVNFMAGNLTSQVRSIAQVATAVAKGDLTRKIDVDARGEILELKTTINTMVDQLSSFAAEVTRVAREVGTEGRLGGQAEVEGVSGAWKRLTENVNELAGNLTRQVRAIAEVTSAVTKGDLTRSINVVASGEVAELKDNINSMVESLRETTRANQDQDWLKTNLAKISGLMQGRRDLTVVAELIMDELAPMVGGQYGAFYLAEDGETPELRLIGSYGAPDEGRPIRFRFGQSLVGQAARSRRTITVEDVPADYVTISSGLGRARPTSLLVLPLVFEEQVLGVIELASVHAFTQMHRDFLEQLMETVGVNVNTLVANARTDELLGESQRLTAELQARSRELQARQEELQRSNAELEDKAALLATQNRDIETKNLEIEQASQELEARAQQLALASKYKSEFLANMSHELRTPLNSLLILAQLLTQNPSRNLTPKQVEYASIIHSAGSDLLQLINDILDLSKVEAGKMDISPERVGLRQLLDYVDATFQPLTQQKNLGFEIITEPGVPVDLLTDDSRVRQVLSNLLSNAVKFTESGGVTLRVALATPDELPATVRRHGSAMAFQVRDTGIGIAEHQLETIFGAFQQADGTTSRKYGGTGLGLSISREIAYLLGGVITAESILGSGSTFTLYLPIARPDFLEPPSISAIEDLEGPAASVVAAANAALEEVVDAELANVARTTQQQQQKRRVLVIEDHPRGLLSLVSESAVLDATERRDPNDARPPVEVVTAVGTDEARAVLAGEGCQWVVLELDMPDDAANRFLGTMDAESMLDDVPVLAHHSRPLTAERDQELRARMASHPLEVITSLDELRARISAHLNGDWQHGVLAETVADNLADLSGTADAELAGRGVLVVDDDARNVYALTSILELHGMRVLQAENGKTGIDTLNGHPEIDLVLMDVMMPEMDGYSATAAIRAMPEYRELPIIAVTAKAMPGDREKSIDSGATDYVTKPVDANDLIRCIKRWLPTN